jgi:hypothetical protein
MRGLTIAGAVLTAAVTAAVAAAQPADDARLVVAARASLLVERFTGPVERHCGIYTITDAANFNVWAAVDRRQMRAALRCVTQARKTGRGTWVLWEVRGIDTTKFQGYAVSPDSDVHLVEFDQIEPGSVHLRPCLRPLVQKDLTTRCTNRDQPLSARELEAALSRIERDLSRSLGQVPPAAIAAARQRATTLRPPVDAAEVSGIVAEVQASVRAAGGGDWPLCPLHGTHALEHREGYWFCSRKAVFFQPLGRLPAPRRQKGRP